MENTESFDQILTDNAYSSTDGVLVRNDKEYPICLQPNAGLVSPNDVIASAIQLTPDIIKEGTEILGMTGTLKIGVDTTDGTATADDIALNKIAYVKGNRLVGTILEHKSEDILVPNNLVYLSTQGLQVMTAVSQKEIMHPVSEIVVSVPNDQIASQTRLESDWLVKGKTLFGVTGTSEVLPESTEKIYNNQEFVQTSSNLTVNDTDLYFNYNFLGNKLFYTGSKVKLRTNNDVLAAEIGLTPNIIKKDSKVLGITGTYIGESGAGTEDATATEWDIVEGQTAYVDGQKITGSLPVKDITYTLSVQAPTYSKGYGQFTVMSNNLGTSFPNGVVFKNNQIKITIPQSQIASAIGLTSEMIAEGQTVLGIQGSFTGSGVLSEEEYAQCEAIADRILAEEAI